MNVSILAMLSGPLMAAVRYGAAIGATALATRGYTDGATATTIMSGAVAAASALLGLLTSTHGVAVARVEGTTPLK